MTEELNNKQQKNTAWVSVVLGIISLLYIPLFTYLPHSSIYVPFEYFYGISALFGVIGIFGLVIGKKNLIIKKRTAIAGIILSLIGIVWAAYIILGFYVISHATWL